MIIAAKWAALVVFTQRVLLHKLDKKEISSSRFRLFLGNLYSCKGMMNKFHFLGKLLKPSASISEMFETLTMEREWDFINYYLLESIIEEYGDERTVEMMQQYKRDLTGYVLVTKIKDYLEAVDLKQATNQILPIPREKLHSLLSIKLKVSVSYHSLKYFEDVWHSLQLALSLPSPTLVLHRIAQGSTKSEAGVEVKDEVGCLLELT